MKPPNGNARRFPFVPSKITTEQFVATLPITKRGAELLKAELHKLKTVDRPWVINAIAEARAQGDFERKR